MVKVTGGSNKRVSLAALIAIEPGHRPRLIYRVHKSRRRGTGQRKGFTETGCAALLDAAHQQLADPTVVVWANLNVPIANMRPPLTPPRPGLTVSRLPPYALRTSPRPGPLRWHR